MLLARFFSAVLAATLATATFAQDATPPNPELGDRIYQPTLGQSGKDVVWIPTPDSLVHRMLSAAEVTKNDLVYDLGSGDGKIPIAAAKQFNARAVGIEYNPDMANLSRRNVERAGVQNMVNIITGDVFVEDFSKATVVTMYLLPDLNLKLRPILLKMKPGTRIATHQFLIGDWEPDMHFQADGRDGYLWYVPADVAGEWTFKGNGGASGTLALTQRYQKVAGTFTAGGKTQPLLGVSLKGDRLAFSFIDTDNALRSAKLTVAGNAMNGEMGYSQVSAARKR